MSKDKDLLEKCDAIIDRLYAKAPKEPSDLAKSLMKAFTQGWTPSKVAMPKGGLANVKASFKFTHPEHGDVHVNELEDGSHEVRHGGQFAGVKGQKGTFSGPTSAKDALTHANTYMDAVNNKKVLPRTLQAPNKLRKEDVEKSNYGKFKGGSQYDTAANVQRKANNTGDVVGSGLNTNVKSFSTKPSQLSAKQQAGLEAKKGKKLSGPVKVYTPEEVAARNVADKLKKSYPAWANHNPVPNADEEIKKAQARNPAVKAENLMANQLANLMQGRTMLGSPPPSQPTNEQMFGGMVVTEEMAKAAENKWNNTFSSWMEAAQQPISKRFASEEEEIAYWSSLKVSDRDDGKSGY